MKEFTLKLNGHQMQVLNKALLNMKYKHVTGLIATINMQLSEPEKVPPLGEQNAK